MTHSVKDGELESKLPMDRRRFECILDGKSLGVMDNYDSIECVLKICRRAREAGGSVTWENGVGTITKKGRKKKSTVEIVETDPLSEKEYEEMRAREYPDREEYEKLDRIAGIIADKLIERFHLSDPNTTSL